MFSVIASGGMSKLVQIERFDGKSACESWTLDHILRMVLPIPSRSCKNNCLRDDILLRRTDRSSLFMVGQSRSDFQAIQSQLPRNLERWFPCSGYGHWVYTISPAPCQETDDKERETGHTDRKSLASWCMTSRVHQLWYRIHCRRKGSK